MKVKGDGFAGEASAGGFAKENGFDAAAIEGVATGVDAPNENGLADPFVFGIYK